MIALDQVTKSYKLRDGNFKPVLEGITFSVQKGEKLGILGANGSGKSTLIRLLGGAELPTSGRIERRMSVSWPLAFGGAFQTALSGLDNLKFICRVYGVPIEDKIPAVLEFSELGDKFYEPLRTYSAGMRARLAFAISLSVEFDCFLIDEIMAVGDQQFQLKCDKALLHDRSDRAMIIASHHPYYIQEHCTRVVVLDHGKLHHFDSVKSAFAYYERVSA